MFQQLSHNQQRNQQRKNWQANPTRYRYGAVICLLTGILLSGGLAYTVRHEENKKIQLTLQLRSLLISTTLQRSVRNNLESFESISDFFRQEDSFSEADFQKFVATEFKNRASITAVSWVPRIPQAQRQTFEAQHQAQFTEIREIDEQGRLQSVTPRPEYFPILYTTTDETKGTAGLDLSTSATVATAMNQARDSGKTVATLAVDAFSEASLDQLRLLVLIPVYKTPTIPEGMNARREALSGFFTGELLIFNVVRGSFDELNMGGIDVFVTEEAEDTRLLHVHKKRNGDYVEGTLQELDETLKTQNIYANTSLELSGSDWTLFFIPNSRFFESQQTKQWMLVLVAGWISTFLLSLYIKRQGDYSISTQALLNQLAEKNQGLETALSDLKRTQTQAIQTEKLSALGKMVGGIAHEINNPVSFIAGNLIHLQADCNDLIQVLRHYQTQHSQPAKALPEDLQAVDVQFLEQDLPKAITSMKTGAHRIRDIVLALRTFARVDETGKKRVDLHTGLDSTLLILEHRLKEQESRPAIQVTKIYGELPTVECLPGQLNQVFMHLLNNAIEAVDDAWKKGKWATTDKDSFSVEQSPQIWIFTTTNLDETANETISIRIVDNGLGIPKEIHSQLFDPFFSTKPIGQGTGLGLSISYQVIQRHGGHLTYQSANGEKTEFVITLPLTMPAT